MLVLHRGLEFDVTVDHYIARSPAILGGDPEDCREAEDGELEFTINSFDVDCAATALEWLEGWGSEDLSEAIYSAVLAAIESD